MTVAVDVTDSTGLVGDEDAVRGLVEAVLAEEGLSGDVAVAFVDEQAITALNERYRDTEGPTDVLSFDYAADERWPAGIEGVSGEIVVCPRVVARYAADERRDPGVQLGWTLIHGALHLAGYDHETDRGEMRLREQELLERLRSSVRALTVEAGAG